MTMTTKDAMLVVSKGTIQVGKNFVEAVTGEITSHGNIELRRTKTSEPMIYVWVSTLDIASTEHILREAAQREKLHVSCFKSQACPDRELELYEMRRYMI